MALLLRHPRPGRTEGQSLAEFALVFPLFLIIIFSILEFAFVFNALLSVGHAARDAALIAAEAGNSAAADCMTLRSIEADIGAPASAKRVQNVLIFRSDANGTIKNSNSYSRSGSTTCTMADGSKVTVPYSATTTGYKPIGRCNVVKGCCKDATGAVTPLIETTCPPNTTLQTLDTIGVRITYRHNFITPLATFVALGGGRTLTQSTTMRMEPVL